MEMQLNTVYLQKLKSLKLSPAGGKHFLRKVFTIFTLKQQKSLKK